MTPGNVVTITFFLETETVTTKIVCSKSFKVICRQLLLTMNVLRSHKQLGYNQICNAKVRTIYLERFILNMSRIAIEILSLLASTRFQIPLILDNYEGLLNVNLSGHLF